MRRHHRQVEQHADRGEEHAAEEGAERHDVVEGLQAVLRLRDDEPGQERADREREPRRRRGERRPHREEPHAQGEQVAVAGLDDAVQGPADHEPPARDEGDHRREPQPEPGPEAAGPARRGVGAASAGAGREQGHDEHEGHDGEVLEQQDGDGLAAVRRVELAAVGEALADDGGGRQGREGAVEEALARREAEQRAARRREAHHPEHLQAARDQNRRAPPQHLRQRELEPDLEQQQHHPDLGEGGDRVGLGDERRAVGTDGDADQQEPHQRRHAQAVREGDDGYGEAHDEGQVAEDGKIVHGRTAASRRQRPRRRKYSIWYSRTLRLCSRRVSANTCEPSLRLTKYRCDTSAGATAARRSSPFGAPMGPGGSPG